MKRNAREVYGTCINGMKNAFTGGYTSHYKAVGDTSQWQMAL